MDDKRLRIAAYTRVSTSTEDQLNSLENQNSFFEEYAKNKGYSLVRIYADSGISGLKLKNRLEFKKLMDDARKGMFDIVVAKDISRFSRNMVDFLNAIRELKSLGIKVYFLANNQEFDGQSEFILQIFAGLAQEESNNISKRTKWGKRQRSLQEGSIPTIVYGYDIVQTKSDSRKKSILVINDKEADIVKYIFMLYTTQGYGALKIAHDLNSKGIRTKRGSRFTQTAVCRLLKNELYTGKIINNKQEVTDFIESSRANKSKDEWIIHRYGQLAIIDEATFNKAQYILQKRNNDFKTNKTRQSGKHIFSTLLRCTSCGYSFRHAADTYSNSYNRYICSGRNQFGRNSCPNSTVIAEKELLESLKGYFNELIKDKQAFLNTVLKEFNKLCKKNNNIILVKSFEDLKKDLNRQNTKRSNTIDLYTDGVIGKAELQSRIAIINKEILTLENEMATLERGITRSDKLKERVMQMLSSTDNIINARVLTNNDLKRIIDRIEVAPGGEMSIVFQKADCKIADNTLRV